MRKFTFRWLNDAELSRLGGRYVGRVARVAEEQLHNRFTGDEQAQPVIYFEDGLRLVPNLTMRVLLVESLGHDTDVWVGRRLLVFHERRLNARTKREVMQKVVRVWGEDE